MVLIPGRIESPVGNNFPFSNGLDLGRCVIGRSLGVYESNPTAVFLAGMLVSRDAAGLIIPAAGADPIGVAKWNKTIFLIAPVVNEPLVTVLNTAVNLRHANVVNVKVADALGNAYTDGVDYSWVAINGTVTDLGVGIPLGATVFVTYTFLLTPAEVDLQGLNFFNRLDDSTLNLNRITIIQDWSLLFTTQYDTSQVYTMNQRLYCGGGVTPAVVGLFTNQAAEGDYVGKVAQIPTAQDPFLGVEYTGNPI